ncbi:hypothetical protein Chor_013761, partial [Crotalus horridus]
MASRAAGATERERGSGLVVLPDEDKINKDDEAMAWKLLSLAEVSIMLEQDIAGVEKSLEEFLNLKHRLTNLKEAALLDYYVSGFWWAKGLDFSSVQIGGFLTLLNLLLDNLETYHMTLEENIQELASAMAGIGLSNSEISSGFEFFTVDQAKAIINYVKSRKKERNAHFPGQLDDQPGFRGEKGSHLLAESPDPKAILTGSTQIHQGQQNLTDKTSLFQHYTLYEYLFHSPREELVTGDE